MLDLLCAGMFEGFIPLVAKAHREQIPEQRCYLFHASLGELPVFHHPVQGRNYALRSHVFAILRLPGQILAQNIDEGPLAGGHPQLQTPALEPARWFVLLQRKTLELGHQT